jgi:hypothetical protein
MAHRKNHTPERIVSLLRQVEVAVLSSKTTAQAKSWYTNLICCGTREVDKNKATGGQGQQGLPGRATSVSETCFGGVLLSPRSCLRRSAVAS